MVVPGPTLSQVSGKRVEAGGGGNTVAPEACTEGRGGVDSAPTVAPSLSLSVPTAPRWWCGCLGRLCPVL